MFPGSTADLFRGQSLGDLYAQPIDQPAVPIPGHPPGLYYRLLTFCPAQGITAAVIEQSLQPMNGEDSWTVPLGPQDPSMQFLFARVCENQLKIFSPEIPPQWKNPDSLLVNIGGNVVHLLAWDDVDTVVFTMQLSPNVPHGIYHIPHKAGRSNNCRPPLDILKMGNQKFRKFVKMWAVQQYNRYVMH
ncbi:hypothetical protein F5879DRAFT_708477 [Lentinula edodes]|nr:hypothetical protein F5879DRAFT_708477 [Lentinula edodes]